MAAFDDDPWLSDLAKCKEPPLPTTLNMQVAKVPRPLDFPADMSDEQCARVIAKLYREAVRVLYKAENVWLFANVKDITATKNYKLMVKAAHAMRDLQIAPASWIAWSIDQWRAKEGNSNRLAPLKYILNLDRIAKLHGIFRRTGEIAYGGSKRRIFNSKHHDVMERYTDYIREWRRLPHDPSEEETLALVQKHFPGGWQWYYQIARQQGQEDSEALIEQRNAWAFLWG